MGICYGQSIDQVLAPIILLLKLVASNLCPTTKENVVLVMNEDEGLKLDIAREQGNREDLEIEEAVGVLTG